MAEQDPKEYRGGVEEDDSQGIVPREMVDDPAGEDSSDPQALGGDITDKIKVKTNKNNERRQEQPIYANDQG